MDEITITFLTDRQVACRRLNNKIKVIKRVLWHPERQAFVQRIYLDLSGYALLPGKFR